MANYLITGCSRGLGLALTTELATLPHSTVGTIFATARNETSSLQALVKSSSGRVVFVKLDTTNESDIAHAVKHVESVLGSRGLDVLINNAGVMPITPGDVQAMTDLDEVMRTNVTSVQMVTSAFLPLVSKGREKKVFNM
jgi:NAD(P)-dependent dehydrogenase (short-subunit alcohol dehydrogenase family)